MKNFIFALVIICSILTLQAQSFTTTNGTDKYIEIKVNDTIMVDADQFVLVAAIEEEKESWDDWEWAEDDVDDNSAEEVVVVIEENDNYLQEKQDAIKTILKKYQLTDYKFTPENENSNPFSKEFSLYENAFKINIKDIAVLEKVKREINALENVTASIAEATINNKHPYELQLIEKLMQKANAEANAIATAMQVKLGKPLNVSNQSWDDMYSSMFNNKESMGGLGAMFTLMGQMFKNNAENPTKVTISKSLIVRYTYE